MSGFGFHLRCPDCGLQSRMYPYLYPDWSRVELVLPGSREGAADFEHVRVPIAADHSSEDLARVVTEGSRGALRIARPVIEPEQIRLRPPLPCPRCGAAVEAPYGPPTGRVRVLSGASLEALIQASRELGLWWSVGTTPPGGGRWIRCDRCEEEDGSEVMQWTLRGEDGGEAPPLLEALRALLVAAGSRLGEVSSHRGQHRFDEWPPQAPPQGTPILPPTRG